MIALIDGDIVAYRAAASCEPTKIKPEREEKFIAIARALDIMSSIMDDTGADKYRVFLSGSRNYRKDIYPLYKANRTAPPPEYLADVGAYLIQKWNAEISDGQEADDDMGIAQSIEMSDEGISENHHTSCICSIDKDLLQIPGAHYNFVTKEFRFIDEHTGWLNFYKQLIFGDRSDNIPGYDGLMRNGQKPPKFLEPILNELADCYGPEDMYDLVKQLYDSQPPELQQDMHRNAQLLYIRRKEGDQWVSPRQLQKTEKPKLDSTLSKPEETNQSTEHGSTLSITSGYPEVGVKMEASSNPDGQDH